jgi:hypothetical protein
MSSPSCLKNPWRSANSTNELFQKPRWATATLKVSAATLFVTTVAIPLMRMAMVVRMAFPVIGCLAASGSEHGKRIPGGAKRNGHPTASSR